MVTGTTTTKVYKSVIPEGQYDTKFNEPIYNGEGLIIGHKIIADLKLITDVEELKEFAKTCEGKVVAVDTETTGLSYLDDVIVGFSISLDAYSGIYVPIRHQYKKVTKTKVNKLDENREIMLTKTGKPRQQTIESYEFTDYEKNMDPKTALDILYEIMLKAKFVLMHNSEFDLNMIKKEGYDVLKCITFDTMLLPYIYDPEARLNGLKQLTKHLLGRHIQDFSEVTKGEKEFQYTNPEESYVYAACDSANTYGIYKKLYPLVRELLAEPKEVLKFNGKRYNVLQEDNKLIRAFVDYYGHVKINVDRNAAIAYKELIEKETKETVEKIYGYFNEGPFSLSTGSKEFQGVMKKYNMETGAMTKTGKRTSYGKDGIKEMSKNQRLIRDEVWPKLGKIFFTESKIRTEGPAKDAAYILINFLKTYGKPYFTFPNKDRLVTVLEVRDLNNQMLDKATFAEMLKHMFAEEKKKLEVLQNILKYSSLMKALNSYVTKLTEVDECRMRYRLTGTKSCRLSSGNGSKTSKDKNNYYIDLNAQNLSKSPPQFYIAKEGNGEWNVLGWEFTPVDEEYAHSHKEEEYIVEGFKQSSNIRSCIVAPKGRLIASLDYSSEESKVLTIQSNDPVMRDGYLRGLDPHEVTAVALFGAENYNGKTRKLAKGVNFGFNYGMGYRTLAENLSLPIEEAKTIYEKYIKTYFVCMQWKQQQVDEMYRNKGKVFTVFGRPRQLLPWIRMGRESGDDGVIKYAERSTISHLIQSCCGDIMRSDFMNVYNRFFKNRDPYIDFVSSVHDELNFSIQIDHVVKYVDIIDKIMTIKYLDPDIPITTSIELGHSLGNLFPFVWSDETRTKLIPERVK